MISAIILKRLKADAERRVGPIRRVVITVPAYFDHTRREATCEAARLAGLEVADLLNEPTAAALAYGFQEGFLDQAGALDGRKTVRKGVMTVVVYDLGGGTFDVTVMQIRDRQFKTLVTDGDVRLGGRDWDRRIVDHAAARLHGRASRRRPARRSRLTLQALLPAGRGGQADAERTVEDAAGLHAPGSPHGHRAVPGRVRRADGRPARADSRHDEARPERGRTRRGRRSTSSSCRADRPGCRRWSRMLRDLSGQEPDRSISPDEAVAHGAALYHGMLRTAGDGRPGADGMTTKVVNVNAHSLGLVTRTRLDRPALHLDPDPAEHAAAPLRQPGLPDRQDRPAADPDPDRGGRRARPRGLHPARRVLHRAAPPRPPRRLADSAPLHVRPERTDQGPGGSSTSPACGRRSRSPAGARRSARRSRTGP